MGYSMATFTAAIFQRFTRVNLGNPFSKSLFIFDSQFFTKLPIATPTLTKKLYGFFFERR
ncbi:MAG: hypothetical protein DESF_01297 [Desulfovibrio sp.]